MSLLVSNMKTYTIDCVARHEGEAAGKLQQILNQVIYFYFMIIHRFIQ